MALPDEFDGIERLPKVFFLFVEGRWVPSRIGDGRHHGKRATAVLVPSHLTVSDVRREIVPYLVDARGPIFVLSGLMFGNRGPESPTTLMVKAMPGFEGAR